MLFLFPFSLLHLQQRICKFSKSNANSGKNFRHFIWSTWVDFGFFGVVPHFMHFLPNFLTTAALSCFHSDDCKKLLPLSFNLCAISLSFFPYLIFLFGECLSKAKPYRVITQFSLCLWITSSSEPCHRIALDRLLRLASQPLGSILSPPPLL